MKDRVSFIDHKGKKIFFSNFSNMGEKDTEEIFTMVEDIKKIFAQQPENSVLALGDITNIHVSKELDKAFTEMIKHNKPYVKRSAVLGVSGIKKSLFNIGMVFTKRDIKIFNDIKKAKDWLIED